MISFAKPAREGNNRDLELDKRIDTSASSGAFGVRHASVDLNFAKSRPIRKSDRADSPIDWTNADDKGITVDLRDHQFL